MPSSEQDMFYLDKAGLQQVWGKIGQKLGEKVDKTTFEEVSNNFNDALNQKLNKADCIGVDYAEESDLITFESLENLTVKPITHITAYQTGTGEPSPDNIRTIEGWKTVELNCTGSKNVLVGEILNCGISNKTIVSGGKLRSLYASVKPGRQYTISRSEAAMQSGANRFAVAVTQKKYAGTTIPAILLAGELKENDELKHTVQIPEGYSHLYVYLDNQKTDIDIEQYWACEGEIALDKYEPYKGQILTASLSDGNLFYGGTINWTTGESTITHLMKQFDGSETWVASSDGSYYYSKIGEQDHVVINNGFCSHYPTKNLTSSADNVGMQIINVEGEGACVAFRPDPTVIPTIEAWKEFLVAQNSAKTPTPIQVCYQLTQPQTLQLSGQIITTYTGKNTLWSNAGKTSGYINTILTDTTLSKHGVAADAKATGNVIGNLEELNSGIGTKTSLVAAINDIYSKAGSGSSSSTDLTGVVRYDIAQTELTDDDKARARANIGVTNTGADISEIIDNEDDSEGSAEKVWSSRKSQALKNSVKDIEDKIGNITAQNEALTNAVDELKDILGDMDTLQTNIETENLVDAIIAVNDKVGSGITVDTELKNSTNPVQNKAIYAVTGDIDELDESLVFDEETTKNLVNAINILANRSTDIDISDIINNDVTDDTTTWSSSKIADAINDAVAGETLPTGRLYVECWGDSLTLGSGADSWDEDKPVSESNDGYDYTGCYPQHLQNLLGSDNYEVKNYGVGGETIETILGREGTYPMVVMPTEVEGGDNDDPESGGNEEGGNTTSGIEITKDLTDSVINVSLNDTVILTAIASGATTYQWQTAIDSSFTDQTIIESGQVNADGSATLEITVSNDNINKYYRCVFANSDGDTPVTATTKVVQIILTNQEEDVPEEGSIIYWGDDNRPGPSNSYYYDLEANNEKTMITPLSTTENNPNKCYLFFIKVEAGKTYTFYTQNTNESTWNETAVQRLGFSDKEPIYTQGWIISFVNGSSENSWMGNTIGKDISNFIVPNGANYIIFLYKSSEYDNKSICAICEAGTVPPDDLPSNSLPKDYWNGYKTPLASNINVTAAFGFEGTFKGIKEDEWGYETPWEPLNLYACKIEGGKIYAISNQNGAGINPIAARRLAFTIDQPTKDSNDSNLYTATGINVPEGNEYGNPAFNTTYNLYNASIFLSPENAKWVVFAINQKFIEDTLEERGIEYSIQEVASKDTLPTYPTQSSPNSTTTSTSYSMRSSSSSRSPLTILANGTTNIPEDSLKSIIGANVAPVRQSNFVNTVTNKGDQPGIKKLINPCCIGGIKGDLKWHAPDSTKPSTMEQEGYYSFDSTVYYSTDNSNKSDYVIKSPTPIITAYMQKENAPSRDKRILILWAGQNNAYYGNNNLENQNPADFAENLITMYRAVINNSRTDKYLILSAPIADPANNCSITNYTDLYKLMQKEFGAHYINVAEYLVKYAMSEDQWETYENYFFHTTGENEIKYDSYSDSQDYNWQRVPTSLRAAIKTLNSSGSSVIKCAPDFIHLNSDGYKLVAQQVYDRGKLLGYW